MGQTLTHGVYLPDEGERNCYAGLAANWQLLNSSIGTIASHTTALAGKAPLVHTHTKSDITDFPAYGTTAGTICEGNDARLSDARTPVAHTHTKSDVTDLLNSNFIPSANNSYDLGSSSYQWNNLYAKNYFYNGTEFQNKFVTLDTEQIITGRKNFKTSYSDILPKTATLPSSTRYYVAQRDYAYNDESLTLTWGFVQTSGMNVRRWYVYPYSSGDSVYFQININTDASSSEFKTNVKSVIPVFDNATDLGTSGNRFKTLNGINPGALSLPNQDAESINLSGSITVLDGSTSNNLTQTVNGWLFIYIENTTGAYIRCYVGSGSGTRSIIRGIVDAEQTNIYVFIPIYANITVSAYINATSIARARFYPCLGNV